jgi:hypothetical protein
MEPVSQNDSLPAPLPPFISGARSITGRSPGPPGRVATAIAWSEVRVVAAVPQVFSTYGAMVN